MTSRHLSSLSSRCFSSGTGASKTTTAATTSAAATANANHDRLLVVGSGVAGSAAALIAAEIYKIPVTLLFAGSMAHDCNSWWAQGGIIYRNYDPSSGDSAASLADDIHRAGAGLCDDDAVQKVAHEGPDRVRQLLLGAHGGGGLGGSRDVFANVPFDRSNDGELSLCLGKYSEVFGSILLLLASCGRLVYQLFCS